MVKVSASLLAANFLCLEKEINRVLQAGVDYLHYDVMDGMFVPNISFGMDILAQIRKVTDKPLDVHLMIEQPERYVQRFVEAGADIVTVHPEATKHLHRTLGLIRECGAKAGIVLNPATSVDHVRYVLDVVDMVLIMTVNPGFGGQALIPATVDKIAAVKQILAEAGSTVEIEVDGGVNVETAPELIRNGAQVLVAGSAVFGATDPAAVIRAFKSDK